MSRKHPVSRVASNQLATVDGTNPPGGDVMVHDQVQLGRVSVRITAYEDGTYRIAIDLDEDAKKELPFYWILVNDETVQDKS
jgi:hypothetical protein